MRLPLQYNLRNLVVRRTMTLMTAGGIALVVAVLVLTLALAHGFSATLVATGRADNAIVLRGGATSEMMSSLSRESARIVAADPAVARGPDGEPLAQPEMVVLVNLVRRGDPSASSNVSVRGVDPQVFALRPDIRLREGRMLRPGMDEVLVGRKLDRRFEGCGLGETLHMGGRDWRVVGTFDAGGSGFDSEIWGDREAFLPAFDRVEYSSLTLRLTDPARLADLLARLEGDPRVRAEPQIEREYYRLQSQQLAGVIRALGLFLVVVMAAGAVFGALNTMYAAVGSRSREIATLLALGFPPRAILASFLVESVLLCLIGGVLGCLLALPVHGVSTGTTNWASFSEVAFEFRISPGILAIGLLASVVLGLVGGYFPARAAARRTVSEALRAG
ncbi:MAG: ABC transporter permease [bacterium]|nr:ABC transporter permease [bacterium]